MERTYVVAERKQLCPVGAEVHGQGHFASGREETRQAPRSGGMDLADPEAPCLNPSPACTII